MLKSTQNRRVAALKVHQWLKAWNRVDFSPEERRRKPEPHFYLFSLPAVELRSLCGIARRQAGKVKPRAADLGIQREHDVDRSEEIARFVEYGYPWSTLSNAKRQSNEFNDLRKPGWLPTAIVVNILQPGDDRDGHKVAAKDTINLDDGAAGTQVILPYEKWSAQWRPDALPPLEVIDGQHRLWAFEPDADLSFEVPVVAFHSLDISWQAYLFWTINIKPKRINSSLAFDLYPLLRAEDWLDRAEGHAVYRETRSQELTEALWSHRESPWYDKINMLGERHNTWVSQSAWIKSLMATVVRPWDGSRMKTGGLFGSRMKEQGEVLGWSRAQQAAFLIFAWQKLHDAINSQRTGWAQSLRNDAAQKDGLLKKEKKEDQAFYSPFSLLTTDQGVRGYLHVLNDIVFVRAPNLNLRTWQVETKASANDVAAVELAIKSLSKHDVSKFIAELAEKLASFDWRTSGAPDVNDAQRRAKLVFRGSSGYKELRYQLLEHLAEQDTPVGKTAQLLLKTTK